MSHLGNQKSIRNKNACFTDSSAVDVASMKTRFLYPPIVSLFCAVIVISISPSLALAVTGPGSQNNFDGRRVLVIGIDGVQRAAFQTAISDGRVPNLAQIADTGVAYWNLEAGGIYHTSTQQPTITGPGWSSVCTGVFQNKHGIEDNNNDKVVEGRYYLYPHFFKHIRELYSDSWLGSICDAVTPNSVLVLSENGIANLVYTPTSAEKNAGLGDVKVTEKVVETLQNENPDALFIHFLDADHAGHTYGYGDDIPQYMNTLEDIDGYIGQIQTALQNRPQYAEEKWLIVVTSDHGGGHNKSHGSQSDDDRHIFGFFNGPGFTGGVINNTLTYQDIFAPTILSYLGIGINPEWGMESAPATPVSPYPTPVNGISITDVRRDIRNPSSSDSVTISADIKSLDPLTSVQLWVDAGAGSFSAQSMSNTEDSRWTATLPQYADGTQIKYYIQAATATSSTKLPFPLAPLPFYVFNIEDDRVDQTDLIINEICYNPQGSDNSTNSEWFEVYNRRSEPVDVSFYTVSDTTATPDDFIIPQGTILPANGYMILAWDKAMFLNKYPALASNSNVVIVDTEQAYGINNDGDSPNLVHPNDFEWNHVKSECFEEVPYEVSSPWPGPSTDGFSIELKNPNLDNTLPGNWSFTAASGGTPGQQNSAFEANAIGILNVERSLEYPTSADTIRISADILSDTPLLNATVHTRIGNTNFSFIMTHDAGHRWFTQVGPFPSGALIRFYISALASGTNVVSPAGAPLDRYRFRVDDFPAMPGDLVINELQYDPDGSDNGNMSEWFEIVNTTPRSQDVSFFKFRTRKDNAFQVFPEDTVIPPHGYLVVAGVESLFTGLYPSFGSTGAVLYNAAWPQPSSMMTNSNNSLIEVRINHLNSQPVMRWTAPPAIDAVSYKRTDYPWPGEQSSRPNNNGYTVELIHPALDNNLGTNWHVSDVQLGTPGEQNSVYEENSSVNDWALY